MHKSFRAAAGWFLQLTRSQDMTEGTPWKKLMSFSIPLLIGNMVQQLYSTVDAMVVGQYDGKTALASIGASIPLYNLLLVLFIGVSTGAGILVSQFYGARDRAKLSKTVGSSLTLTLLVSAIITVVGPLIARPVLVALGTPENVFVGAVSYLMILCLGIVGCAYYNILAGILRGIGDSVVPLGILLVACLLNIVLDIWFVWGLGMGIAGAAWATVISQAVAALLCLLRLSRLRHILDLKPAMLKPDLPLISRLFALGIPSGVTQMIFSLAIIMVQRLTNGFGETMMACYTAVMRVDGFAMMPNFTFGMAMTTYTGQNIGAQRLDRVEEGTRDGLKMGLCVSVALTLGLLLMGRPMISWFVKDEQEVIDLGVHMIRILAVGYVAMSVVQILGGVMRGAGDTLTPMAISIFMTAGLRMPLAYLIAYLTRSEALPQGSPDSLYISLLISWIVGAVLSMVFFRWGRWRRKTAGSALETA